SPVDVPAEPQGSSAVQRWLPAYDRRVGGDATVQPTEAEATAAARATPLILATRWMYRGHVAAMKRANPRVRIYAYSNLGAVPPAEAARLPESALAHDAHGARVITPYGNVLGDIDSAAWVRSRIDDCRQALAISGYDGCYLDNVGSSVLVPGYLRILPV